MKPTLFICISLFFISCQNNETNDLAKADVKGNVREVIYHMYSASDSLDNIKKGRLITVNDSKFNKDGNTIESNSSIWLDSLSNKIESKYLIEYKNGKKVSTIDSRTHNVKEDYKYDNQNNIIEVNAYNNNESLATNTKNKYNNNNLCVESATYDNEGKLIKKLINKYTSSNKLLEQTRYSSDNKVESTMTYHFDEKNTVNGYKYISAVNTFTINYRYLNFDKENWLKLVMYENSRPVNVVERKIYYY